MSTISALWQFELSPGAAQLSGRLLRAQTAFGPEGQDSLQAGAVTLGLNRLSRLAEDRLGQQPRWSPGREFCMVADVRLDNREELAQQLSLGSVAELADQQILQAAWLRWGVDCLDQLVGDFAFVIWTPSRQELFAARDHTGQRPLHFHRNDRFLAISSLAGALLALPGVFTGFDEERVFTWLALVNAPHGRSFFNGVQQLPAGHWLLATRDKTTVREYWHPTSVPAVRLPHDEDYAEALGEILDRATEARLRTAGGGAGVLLSAGMDSAAVTASAARLLGHRGERLVAFTSVPRPAYDPSISPRRLNNEAAGAADVARMYPNVDHVLVDTTGYGQMEGIRAWTDAMSEPARNTNNLLWVKAMLDQSRERGLGVLLTGAVGNGTISYRTLHQLRNFLVSGRWLSLWRLTRDLRADGHLSYRMALANATYGLVPMAVVRRLTPGSSEVDLGFTALNPDMARRYDLHGITERRMYGHRESPKEERGALYGSFDFGPINAAVQALGGIEWRDPTGDRRIYEFCYGIPDEQYTVGGKARSLIRRAMQDRLPASTLARVAEGYQGADWYLSMGESLPGFREEIERLESSPAAARFLDLAYLRRLTETWPSTGYGRLDVTDAWHLALSRGVSMGYFLRSQEEAAAARAKI